MTETIDQKKSPASETAQLPGVGGVLRAARLQKGIPLEEIASAIHIRVGQLRALEEGNLAALPGMTYAVGFVKIYAGILKLDSADLARRFRAEHAGEAAQKNLHMPETETSSGSQPSMALIGGAALVAVVLLVSWAMFSKGGDAVVADTPEHIPAAPVVATVSGITQQQTPPPADTPPQAPQAATTAVAPETTTAPAPAQAAAPAVVPPAQPVVQAQAETPAATKAKPEEEKPAQDKADKPEEVAEKKKPEEAAPPAAAAPQKKEDKRTADGSGAKKETAESAKSAEGEEIHISPGKSRVTLAAKQSSWVEVRDSKGKTVFKKVLRAGEKFFVPDQPGLVLLTTNAGGLDVVVDGAKVQGVGRPGEIVRGISLKPESLKVTKVRARDR